MNPSLINEDAMSVGNSELVLVEERSEGKEPGIVISDSEPCTPGSDQTEDPDADFASMPLDQLGPKIADYHRQVTQFAALIQRAATSTIESAVTAGLALIAAKDQLGHGEWGDWLKAHVPDLSQAGANRYMKLAREIPHVRNLGELKSVRQAYIATGVIKDPVKKSSSAATAMLDKDTALDPPDLVARFRSMRIFLGNVLPRSEWEKVPPSHLVEMVSDMRQIVTMLEARLPALESLHDKAAVVTTEHGV